jgi:hypothetical protein
MTWRRIIKWLVGVAAVCTFSLFAAALLLPRIIDSQAARERIQTFLLNRMNGNGAIESIDFTWLPRPRVVIRGASLDLADRVSGKIRSIEVHPSLLALMRGQLAISRMEVASPALSVRLPEPSEEPFIDEIETSIRSLLASFATEISGMIVTVTDGSAEVSIGQRAPVVITELAGRLVAPPGEMQLQISCRANVFDSLRIEGSTAGDTLATKGRIRINRLRLRDSMASLFPRGREYVADGETSLNAALTSVGLKEIKAEVESTAPSLRLARGDRETVIEGLTVKGAITRDEGVAAAVIQRLDLVSPALIATGELSVDSASTARLKLAGKDVDVSRLRETALKLAGDIEIVKDLFDHVKSGQVPQVTLQAAGSSFSALWKNIDVAGVLRDGNILAGDPGLDLDDVNGQFVISRGTLEAKQFFARLGKIRGSNGTLRLGLEGRSAPFHLDVMVQADAAELQSLLLRVVEDDGIRKELSRIRDLEGDLSGRLILGEKIDSLSPIISISRAVVRGSHDLIPHPISIAAGRFRHGHSKTEMEDVSGTVGLSSFSGLAGSLSYNGARRIEISSGKFSLDLAQTRNLLNLFAELPKDFKDIDSVQGRLELTSLSLEGPLNEPNRWDFTAAGTLGKIALKHAKLPAAMNLSGGAFNATPARLTVSSAKVNLLDGSLSIDGSVESPYQAPPRLQAAATGSIGAKMTDWLGEQLEWPKQLLLRSPLQVTKSRISLKKDGEIVLGGDVRVADGPALSFDVVRGPQTLKAKEILVVDGERRARMTLALEKDNIAFSFSGALQQETLNRIFQAPPLEGSLIQGDIEVSAFGDASHFAAQGRLAGKELRVPFKDGTAIVDFFFVEADPDAVNVRSANVRWRDSRLSFIGKLHAAAKALRFDMDISADRIVWDELSGIIDSKSDRANNKGSPGISLSPLEGTIRLTADDFNFAGFSSRPLHVTGSFSSHGIRAEIQRGNVCGIPVRGKVHLTDEELGFDLSLSVTGAQLEPVSLCLTDNRQSITGNYSLQAHVAGRGPAKDLLQNLKGKFEFRARDGQFAQSANVDSPLEATFDYLNKAGDFDIAFPDLDRESFPFRSISVRGAVEGTTLANDELVIQSSLLTIAGQGSLDLEKHRIDAQGLVSVRIPGSGIIARIPLLGSILDPSLLGIPVRVTGSLEQPTVSYLSPTDVGAQLVNIPLRILGLPLEAIQLFTPNSPQRENN